MLKNDKRCLCRIVLQAEPRDHENYDTNRRTPDMTSIRILWVIDMTSFPVFVNAVAASTIALHRTCQLTGR